MSSEKEKMSAVSAMPLPNKMRRYWLRRALVPTNRSARLSPGRSPFPAEGVLGEVVADVAEDVLKLTAQEDHGDDDSDRDDSDDECVLHETLAFVVTEECEHPNSPSFLPCSAGPPPADLSATIEGHGWCGSPPLVLPRFTDT